MPLVPDASSGGNGVFKKTLVAGGEVIGFGARRIFDDDQMEAKYVNTPETVVYKKSAVLFGLDLVDGLLQVEPAGRAARVASVPCPHARPRDRPPARQPQADDAA